MTGTITLTVDVPSPSLNTTTRKHWTRYHRQRKYWRDLIMVAKSNAGIYGMPMFERSKVTVHRCGACLLDADNLVGGLKVVIDALKSNGLIADDSPRHMELSADQSVGGPKLRSTRIVIVPVAVGAKAA